MGSVISLVFVMLFLLAIPATVILICGLVRGKTGLAIGGFFACLCSFLILTVPVFVVFMALIFKKKKPKADLEQLGMLKRLFDQGVITEEEYEKMKKDLLGL